MFESLDDEIGFSYIEKVNLVDATYEVEIDGTKIIANAKDGTLMISSNEIFFGLMANPGTGIQ